MGMGFGPWGMGWAAPLYGGWFNGWGGGLGPFWGGMGLCAVTSFGLGSAFGLGTGLGVFPPTWGVSNMGGWGLGSLANDWMSSNYVNPYNATAVASQPASTTIVYDYSQPINVNAAPPDPSAAETSEQVFSAARDSFKAGDYQRALDLADRVVKQTPNAPVIHEFRALCLFALKRYDEAATVAYAALSAGPCWNWATMVGLYADADTYTNQLRALEAAVRSNLNATPPRFLLAYHYLVQGNNDAAGMEFAEVAKLEPKDQLSASLAKALTKAKETSTASATAITPATGAAPATSTASAAAPSTPGAPPAPATAAAPASSSAAQPAEAPPPPPDELTGTWKAAPSADTAITLSIQKDGAFTWDVANKGQQAESIRGRAVYVNDVLSLTQDEGPPLAGKVESKEATKFVFHLMGGGSNAPKLTFTR
jgi:tetratricopeptide (TPR) repeat protein